MATEERPNSDRVIRPEDVVDAASRFGFLQAISLLERLHPDAPKVGGVGPVSDEIIRMRHDPALSFSSGDITRIEKKERRIDPSSPLSPKRTVYEVMTAFLGLTGASSPLPAYFSEEIVLDDSENATQRDFLDLFHHRLLGLFYRLRARLDYPKDFSRSLEDAWSRRVLSLAGVDTYENKPATSIPAWRLLRLSPLLSQRARTPHTIQVALQDVLGDALGDAQVTIEQFVGRWVEIDVSQRIHLGVSNSNLGVDTVLGDKIFDRGGKFRVVLNPLEGNAFRRFLPDGDQAQVVREVVGMFCRDQLDFDMELVLARNATPPLRLAMTDGSKLGLDSWLGLRDQEETRVVVDVSAAPPPGSNKQSASGNDASEAARGVPLESALDSFKRPSSTFENVSTLDKPSAAGEGRHAR